MTTTQVRQPIISAATLLQHWNDVVSGGSLHGRSLWMGFHDTVGRPHDLLFFVDDVPLHPDPDDVAKIESMVCAVTGSEPGAERAVLLFARPGTSHVAPFEQSWATALSERLGVLMSWPICCASPHGVRLVEAA